MSVLSTKGFMLFSQISNPHFSSKSQIYQVESQIFCKSKCANRFSTKSPDQVGFKWHFERFNEVQKLTKRKMTHTNVCTNLNNVTTTVLWPLCRSTGYVICYSFSHIHTHTHPFNGSLSRTTRVKRVKTNLDFTEAKDSEWQWHRLGHMQVCTSLQTDNHASIPPVTIN